MPQPLAIVFNSGSSEPNFRGYFSPLLLPVPDLPDRNSKRTETKSWPTARPHRHLSQPAKSSSYQTEDGTSRIDVRLESDTVWLSQRGIADLFQTTVPNINQQLKAIYEDGELRPEATIKRYLIVQTEGRRQVSRADSPRIRTWKQSLET